MTTTVEAIAHADVKGKILTYVRIKNGKGEVLIQVGEKNYNAVKTITEVEEIKELDKKK